MRLKFAETSFLTFLSMMLCFSASAFAGPVDSWPQKPDRYVTDRAGLIDADTESRLNGLLQELEQKTGVQFVVVTIESLNGETKENLALAIAEHWKIGRKGKDDGLILLLASKERAYRFEVGYGLEGTLTDGFLGQVGRERFLPYMKERRTSDALLISTLTIIEKIAQEKGVAISGMPKLRPMRNSGGGLGSLVSLVVFFLVFSSLFGGARSRRGLDRWRGGSMPFWALFLAGMMGGGRGPRIGGSGGFGSFGGGMGGGFGGGGAGGNW